MAERYAVVCAAHGGNSGMYSVDKGAENFFGAHGADYEMFVSQKDYRYRSLSYSTLNSISDLRDFTHVVYWGDFINNPVYGYHGYPWRAKKWGLAKSREDAIDEWHRLFNPPEMPSHQKIISAGANFQHDFNEYGYRFNPKTVFNNIEKTFHTLFLRDDASHQSLSRQVSFDYLPQVRSGVDCAFLQAAPEGGGRMDPPSFVYFFRRSGIDNVPEVVKEIERSTGFRGIDLSGWLGLKSGKWESSFAEMRETINSSKFVVSDTYHLCVNALQLGRPVIGVGRAQSHQRGTLGDFKKRVLFRMFNLEEFYYEVQDKVDNVDVDSFAAFVSNLLNEPPTEDPLYLVRAKTREFAENLQAVLDLPKVLF